MKGFWKGVRYAVRQPITWLIAFAAAGVVTVVDLFFDRWVEELVSTLLSILAIYLGLRIIVPRMRRDLGDG